MHFSILTIFPHIFDSYLNETILKRAQDSGLIKIKIHNIRDYTEDKHKNALPAKRAFRRGGRVDDKSYGGGPGMIMKIEPIFQALKVARNQSRKQRVILLTPQGKLFNQKKAQALTKFDELIFICGRYEGIDARVDKLVDEKISIGSYVLSGGELPAMVIVEAVTRLLPGVLGNEDSLKEETFTAFQLHSLPASQPKSQTKKLFGCQAGRLLEYPQYTRPEVFSPDNGKTKWSVPKILLSGDHKKIEEWRAEER